MSIQIQAALNWFEINFMQYLKRIIPLLQSCMVLFRWCFLMIKLHIFQQYGAVCQVN